MKPWSFVCCVCVALWAVVYGLVRMVWAWLSANLWGSADE
jgi:hypothetical protein